MVKNVYFELGFIKIADNNAIHSIACEEITLQVQNENIPRYVCDVQVPIDIAPTKKKFTFTIKKPKFFESDILFTKAVYIGDFDLRLFRLISKLDITPEKQENIDANYGKNTQWKRDVTGVLINSLAPFMPKPQYGEGKEGEAFNIEHVLTLHECWVDSANMGSFDGTKPVTEEIQGVAKYMTFSKNVAGKYKQMIQGDEL
jgi:hypothetical protein